MYGKTSFFVLFFIPFAAQKIFRGAAERAPRGIARDIFQIEPGSQQRAEKRVISQPKPIGVIEILPDLDRHGKKEYRRRKERELFGDKGPYKRIDKDDGKYIAEVIPYKSTVCKKRYKRFDTEQHRRGGAP